MSIDSSESACNQLQTIDGCKPIYAKTSEPYIERWNRTYVYEVWLDIDALPNIEEVIDVKVNF
jgi:hypothetical protein